MFLEQNPLEANTFFLILDHIQLRAMEREADSKSGIWQKCDLLFPYGLFKSHFCSPWRTLDSGNMCTLVVSFFPTSSSIFQKDWIAPSLLITYTKPSECSREWRIIMSGKLRGISHDQTWSDTQEMVGGLIWLVFHIPKVSSIIYFFPLFIASIHFLDEELHIFKVYNMMTWYTYAQLNDYYSQPN